MENGAMAGASPLPEMGQHQMSQTWRSTLASPLLSSESSPALTLPDPPGSQLTRALGSVFPCNTAEEGIVNGAGEEQGVDVSCP